MAEMPLPPGRTPPKERTLAQPLSQRAIVAAALRILDAEGLDAVTMRRVAQDLRTSPASLYAYVSGKDEILDLVLEEAAGEVALPGQPDPGRWKEQVKELCRAVRKVMVAHRDISMVALLRIPMGANSLTVADRLLGILLAGGLPKQAAGWAMERLFQYINADSLERALYANQTPAGADPDEYRAEYLSQVQAYYEALPADRFPNTAALLPELMTGAGDERFEFGLEVIVAGLAAYAKGNDS
jgi:AcrR family transcriptional regulator